MALFTFNEIFGLLIMVGVLGYIFMGTVKQPATEYGYRMLKQRFNWEDFKLALYISAPAVVLHELAHKFVAILLGLHATFHVSFFGLGLGIFLKMISSPFVIFVPGYVSISAATHPLMSTLTALAGPATNLLIFGASWFILNKATKLTQQQAVILYMTKQINLFLFFFNMIPLPPFDGYHVFSGIFKTLFSL